jgi:hypothetical protein
MSELYKTPDLVVVDIKGRSLEWFGQVTTMDHTGVVKKIV